MNSGSVFSFFCGGKKQVCFFSKKKTGKKMFLKQKRVFSTSFKKWIKKFDKGKIFY
jgi:hypothetical protein